MNVGELRDLLKDIDDNVNVRICIESGRGLRISEEVDLYLDEDYGVLDLGGEESDYD